jgi:predicted Fe-Mo cluster-binding NifX family protein
MARILLYIELAMKIGVTVWNEQVSPLLDAATQLLLTEVAKDGTHTGEMLQFPHSLPWQRVKFIESTGIETLICGAISREYESLLRSSRVRVIPWTCGRVDDVLDAFMDGRLNGTAYCLPGRARLRRRRRGARGFGAGLGRRTHSWNGEES